MPHHHKILKIGHRGACGEAPENTMASFRTALLIDHADMIETDVWRCKSGEIVITHYEDLAAVTNGTGKVTEKTLPELKKLDAGKGECIPALDELLTFADGKIKLNIEIKQEGIGAEVLEYIKKFWKSPQSNILITSFLFKELENIRKIDSQIQLGVLTESNLDDTLVFARKISAYSINPQFRLINRLFVEKAHQEGFKVFVWTVNESEDIHIVEDMGVDGVISNFPDRVKNYSTQ
jgi:glycerophosphoryl diester phosphodiesterase